MNATLHIVWKHESAHEADFPLPEVSCAASVSLQGQGKHFRDHFSCTDSKQRMCSCQSNLHGVSFVFSRAVQITFFFFFLYWGKKPQLFQGTTCSNCVCVKGKGGMRFVDVTVCFTFIFLPLISFITTGAEESENGTGRKTAGFVLKSPLERIPVSYHCASMEAGRAAPSL